MLQWVVTKVDNGSLHRPRPAYYGPSEEDSDDSAQDMDRSDMETASGCIERRGQGPARFPVQGSPGMKYHHRQRVPSTPELTQEELNRQARVNAIQEELRRMESRKEALQSELGVLTCSDSQPGKPQALGSMNGGRPEPGSRNSSSSPRTMGFSPGASRFSTPPDNGAMHYYHAGGNKATVIAAERTGKGAPGQGAGAHISTDSVRAYQYGDQNHQGSRPGSRTDLRGRDRIAQVPGPHNQQPHDAPLRQMLPPNTDGRRCGPDGQTDTPKMFRCPKDNCKSTFARQSELKYGPESQRQCL